jgi:hypothetical protein
MHDPFRFHVAGLGGHFYHRDTTTVNTLGCAIGQMTEECSSSQKKNARGKRPEREASMNRLS